MAKKQETEILETTETEAPAAVETAITPPVSKYNKQQILKSKRYCERRDLLTALLKDGKQYSHDEVEALIDEFMKGRVK